MRISPMLTGFLLAVPVTAAIVFGGSCGTAKVEGYDCPTADQLREGVIVYCGDQKVTGTVVPGDLPLCTNEVTQNCVAVGSFFVIDRASLVAGDIRKDVVIGGVTGTLEQTKVVEYPDCSSDGQAECVATEDFPAMQFDGASQKIVAGERLGGVGGNAALGNAVACSSEGNDLGCLTNSSYVSISAAKYIACH